MVTDINDIDPSTPISQLTLGQLTELFKYKETRKSYEEARDYYQEQAVALESTKASTSQLFADCEKLKMVTSPFRIRNEEELEKLIVTLKQAVSEGTLLMAIAQADE